MNPIARSSYSALLSADEELQPNCFFLTESGAPMDPLFVVVTIDFMSHIRQRAGMLSAR